MNHDVITLGGSAGTVDLLLNMVGELPADLPASLFVVVHTPPEHISVLPELLSRKGRLPASHPLHDEKMAPGHIYVAPPDAHLMLRPGVMEVVRAARENGHRPAVDALFRTAAQAYGSRVIAVVLSGYQDCGTAGMMSVKARGGVCVVQSPESAFAPDMPRNVLSRMTVDHIVHPLELPGLLVRLAATPAAAPEDSQPDRVVTQLEGTEVGQPVELACPLCQGVLSATEAGTFQYFRCHVGHAFSLESLVREHGEEMERALWAAVRALEEGASLSTRLAAYEKSVRMKNRFTEKRDTQTRQADLIRQILLRGVRLDDDDADDVSEAAREDPAPQR